MRVVNVTGSYLLPQVMPQQGTWKQHGSSIRTPRTVGSGRAGPNAKEHTYMMVAMAVSVLRAKSANCACHKQVFLVVPSKQAQTCPQAKAGLSSNVPFMCGDGALALLCGSVGL